MLCVWIGSREKSLFTAHTQKTTKNSFKLFLHEVATNWFAGSILNQNTKQQDQNITKTVLKSWKICIYLYFINVFKQDI
jgi:hypothetical protein